MARLVPHVPLKRRTWLDKDKMSKVGEQKERQLARFLNLRSWDMCIDCLKYSMRMYEIFSFVYWHRIHCIKQACVSREFVLYNYIIIIHKVICELTYHLGVVLYAVWSLEVSILFTFVSRFDSDNVVTSFLAASWGSWRNLLLLQISSFRSVLLRCRHPISFVFIDSSPEADRISYHIIIWFICLKYIRIKI